jgi:hypothetical protein
MRVVPQQVVAVRRFILRMVLAANIRAGCGKTRLRHQGCRQGLIFCRLADNSARN